MKNRSGSLRPEDYVTSLYLNLLNRSPDAEGFSAHVKFLKNGGDPGRLYETFIRSDEYNNLKRQNASGNVEAIVGFDEVNSSGFTYEMVIDASRRHFSDRRFLKSLENVVSLVGRKKREVKTVAVYYHKMRSGGIERVTAWQVSAWTKLGYRVVLITDEPEHQDDYPYDKSVVRRVIPGKFMWADHGEYVARGRALAGVLQDESVDAFVTNLGHEICAVWDILVAKSLDIPVILGWHNVFDADFHNGHGLDAAQIRLLGHRYADLTAALSTMDQMWFTLNGYSAQVVPNPPTFDQLPEAPSPLLGKTLIWVARADRHQKRVDHVIQMMPLVLSEHPDAKLLVVGSGPDQNWARDLAVSLGVSSRVRFVGHVDDVGAFLGQATLHVMTSEFEGSPMALEEAWAYGLPTVMYDLPHIEFVKSGKGHIAVPQGDVAALARAVSGLLSDRASLRRLGAEARSVSEHFRRQPVADMWHQIFQDLAVKDRMGPTLDQMNLSTDVQEIVRHLSEKLFPPIRPMLGLPVPKQPVAGNLKKIEKFKGEFADIKKKFFGLGYKPLRMIDCTAIPLGDSFMFFSGLYALLENGLGVCAPGCVLHTHKPFVNICRLLFSEFGLEVAEGSPHKVLRPFFFPHPPLTNEDWRRTYLGSDWRMDWVEATDRQKTIERPGYQDTLRKMARLFISERLIYHRKGGWKTATPSYIGFRVWWPIALKLGVYPVVFYSMVSRSLGSIREKLHAYIDEKIAQDELEGKAPFNGNAFFPTGNSYQTIDPETYKYIVDEVGADFTCFVQSDSPWHDDFASAGIKTQHIPSIEDTFKIIRSAKAVVTCCSFTSHVSQLLRDDFVLVMFKDLPENNVNPGANPKVVTYNPPCSPCNYLPRGQYKTCPAGYPHCVALENAQFRDKIVREVKALVGR